MSELTREQVEAWWSSGDCHIGPTKNNNLGCDVVLRQLLATMDALDEDRKVSAWLAERLETGTPFRRTRSDWLVAAREAVKEADDAK